MSPYKCEDNKLMHKKGGVWSVKQTCKNHEACVKAMGLMYAIEANPNYVEEHPKKS